MNARSALFDLYGDHLRARGGQAPVAGLVRLLAPLGVAPPAVRTAVSRMVRQGWLEPVRLPAGPGYATTPRAARRLEETLVRIYRLHDQAWDGSWHLVITARLRQRSERERLREGLSFLGYASVDEVSWIAPRPSPELDDLLAAEGVRADRFTARHDGDTLGLVHAAWDLDGLARSYRRWMTEAEAIVARAELEPDDETAFAVRSRLVHEWRKFLFRDPGLPPELLPAGWPGHGAAAFFDEHSRRLAPGASRFVDTCLAGAVSAPA